MLVQMILEGTNISISDDNKSRDITARLSQFVKFNVNRQKHEQSVLHGPSKYTSACICWVI